MEKPPNGISVAWFITFDEECSSILPSLAEAEAEANQEYYNSTGKLPKWNKLF